MTGDEVSGGLGISTPNRGLVDNEPLDARVGSSSLDDNLHPGMSLLKGAGQFHHDRLHRVSSGNRQATENRCRSLVGPDGRVEKGFCAGGCGLS